MAKGRMVEVKCLVCGLKFKKPAAELKRYPRHCCSIACRSKLNDKRKALECKNCSKTIWLPPSKIALAKQHFCSKECHDIIQTTKLKVNCQTCGKECFKHISQKERTLHDFCSQECKSKFFFADSYVERRFEDLLKQIGVEYSRNDRTIIAPLELDFYLPEIKFAVEINGATHYKPIYGDELLATVKARDRRKRKACKELGITLRIIKPGDCKEQTYLPRYKRVIWEIKTITKTEP